MTVWTYPHSQVRRVIDADTIDVTCDLGMDVLRRVRVRLAGVDAPERGTVAGQAATAFVADLLPPGAEIAVVSHAWEKYGRLLGEIHTADGVPLSKTLLRHGHAKPYDGGPRG